MSKTLTQHTIERIHIQVVTKEVRRNDEVFTVDSAVDGVAAEFSQTNGANDVVTGDGLNNNAYSVPSNVKIGSKPLLRNAHSVQSM